MDFNFSINNLLGGEITKLDRNVTPHRRNADGYTSFQLRSQLFTVIDQMGEASSRAQGLHTNITTGRKLELSPDHILYVMKDEEANGGRGSVLGILKIGHKRLFVYDSNGRVHEMEPLCVLDFYVHESHQRMGCGKKLFENMLHEQNVEARHLAIDKPSYKFSRFLHKHYNLKVEIPQVNNFVVFEGFFSNRKDNFIPTPRRKAGYGRPPAHPYVKKKGDTFGENEFDVPSSVSNGYNLPPIHPKYGTSNSRPNSGKSNQSIGIPTPRSRNEQDFPTQPESYTPSNPAYRPISDTSQQNRQGSLTNGVYPYHRSNTSTYGPGGSLYSRHTVNESRRPHSGILPVTNNHYMNNDYDPPLLRRDGPPKDYYQNVNKVPDHLQGRGLGGRATVIGDINAANNVLSNPFIPPHEDIMRKIYQWQPSSGQRSWTQVGVPPLAARHYSHTRLW